MLEMDVTEPEQTEWALANRVRKDRKIRFRLDFPRLNAVAIGHSYLICGMNEWTHSFGDSKIFNTIVANSGYLQVEVAKRDKYEIAFPSNHGDIPI